MVAVRGPRIPTGSAAWVADERASALQIVDVEVDEFTYAAHNEFSWLNEHMASIFSENETNIAETFKTPGKLRGKTPRTTRKLITTEPRVPLSNVFGGTPSSSANRFAQHLLAQSPQRELFSQAKSSSPRRHAPSPKPTRPIPDELIEDAPEQTTNDIEAIHSDHGVPITLGEDKEAAQAAKSQPVMQGDSGYFGSQDVNPPSFDPLAEGPTSPIDSIALDEAIAFPQSSPSRVSPAKQPTKSSSPIKTQQVTADVDMEEAEAEPQENENASPDDAQSQSDRHSPSPVRPGFRNSLQFPSLPAREPLTAGKSIGARASRTSHVDPKRTSYLGRHTRGKSLASHAEQDASDESDQDEMDVDDFPTVQQKSKNGEDLALHHNKTYTQMLQDRISVLGKSQPNGSRPSKSIHSLTNSQQPQALPQPVPEPKSSSPRKQETTTTPGAFPEDDDDDWIAAPSTQQPVAVPTPTRPSFSKSRTADVMEGIHGKQTLGSFDSDEDRTNLQSPAHANMKPKRPAYLGHAKSVSVPAVPLVAASDPEEGSPLKKTVSGTSVSSRPATAVAPSSSSPSKSPTRLFRDSPLKHLKNKMSSILTTSKGLIASSAALSAEGKSSLLSPSRVQLGLLPDPSSESIAPKASLDSHRSGSAVTDQQPTVSRPVAKRTRASVEREKEEKRREKEARVQAEQMEKLEKEREKEREKARVFSKEQEKLASMEKQVAARKEVETPAPKAAPKPTRSSPRRAKPQEEAETKATDQDADMGDAPVLAPPSAPRSAAPGQLSRPKEMRRIAKPGREPAAKTKATPTVHIKVNTGSQLHPGNSMANGYQDFGASTSSQPPQTVSKASKASTQPKSSTSNFGASTGSNGRPRALDLAAQKKAQDERRRDAKAKVERDRAVQKEEKRKQEHLRRQEEERQKRQALIEKAKKTPAPPPAVRSQPNGPPEYSLQQDKPASVQRADGPPRPPSRMNSGIYRSQDDMGRPVNASLAANGPKPGSKRPLGRDGNEDGSARPPPSRGPQYQAKDAKRRRTSDDFADELDMEQPPNIKGPPVRPSSALKRDLQVKTLTNGYVPQASAHNLFKTGVAQGQIKGGNPMDMAQIHKGPIPFAPNPNPAGPSYKTPGRPGPVNGMKSAAKSVPRSSPRFQNGEAIELPEIQTDDEDEDDDEPQAGTVAAWANSPYIRQALVDQELLDPALIFGPPAPLDMDKVFDKSDRRHRFRDRTSSANWSGLDRLTEEDIRKDLAARDKLRREGGWSYELSKDMN